ncbi:hypothetical protein H4582DRAFT_1818178, partial [Lactarius indigo]
INLLNTSVKVLQDMLQLLKGSVSSRYSERLEKIVIALTSADDDTVAGDPSEDAPTATLTRLLRGEP